MANIQKRGETSWFLTVNLGKKTLMANILGILRPFIAGQNEKLKVNMRNSGKKSKQVSILHLRG